MVWYKADWNIIPTLNLESWEGQIVFLFGINVSLITIWRSWQLHSLTCSTGESNTGPILPGLICLHLKCSSLQNINLPFQRICSLSSVRPSFLLLLYAVNCTDLVNQQWTFPNWKRRQYMAFPHSGTMILVPSFPFELWPWVNLRDKGWVISAIS